jgi:hypothetical protein
VTQSVIQSAFSSFGFSTNSGGPSLTVGAGRDIVVQIYSQQFSVTPAYTVSDGLAYTQEAFRTFNGQYNVAIYRRRNVAPGLYNILVTCASTAANTTCWCTASEVDSDADIAVDQSITNSGSSTTPTTGATAALAQAAEIIFGCFAEDNDSTGATEPPSGYTALNNGSGGGFAYSFFYKVVASTAAVSASQGTLNASRNWGAVLATFNGLVPAAFPFRRKSRIMVPISYPR